MATNQDSDTNIICTRCNRALIKAKVKLSYLDMKFENELLKCPECNQVFITEDLAMGKMLEVERALEEK